jgi:hypothetical protein
VGVFVEVAVGVGVGVADKADKEVLLVIVGVCVGVGVADKEILPVPVGLIEPPNGVRVGVCVRVKTGFGVLVGVGVLVKLGCLVLVGVGVLVLVTKKLSLFSKVFSSIMITNIYFKTTTN